MALLMGVSSWARMVSTTLPVSRLSLPPNTMVLWGAAAASPAQASRQITSTLLYQHQHHHINIILSTLLYQHYFYINRVSLPLPYLVGDCSKTVGGLYQDKGWLSVGRRRVTPAYIASTDLRCHSLPGTTAGERRGQTDNPCKVQLQIRYCISCYTTQTGSTIYFWPM